MKQIIDFIKWFFEMITKLSVAKMIIILVFVSAMAFLGYKLFLEKEKIEYISTPLQDHSGEVMTNENGEEVKTLLPEEK